MQYVNKATLEVNGQVIEDFDSVTIKERELRKPVKLMNKTGYVEATARDAVDVDYIVPATGAFDWASLVEGRLTLELDGGQRITFTGVHTLKIGDIKFGEGEDGAKQTIELGATGRVDE